MSTLINAIDYPVFFARIAALPEEERANTNIRLTLHSEDVYDEQVRVIAFIPTPEGATEFGSIVVVATQDGRRIASNLDDVDDVIFTEAGAQTETGALTLDTITEFPADATVSFSYTTARGTQKRITGLTPAFVRPSETHTGKNILVGFTEQEDGSYARKTFRTDRITNLTRDNA